MVTTVSNKPAALAELSRTYAAHATRRHKEIVPTHQYVLSGAFTAYRKLGAEHKEWVQLYCNLVEANDGLKHLVKADASEVAKHVAQWWREKNQFDEIGKQLDGFPCLAAVPEACRLLYERIDMEGALVQARDHSGIAQSHRDLHSYSEEKENCKTALAKLEDRLKALKEASAPGDPSRSRHTKSRDGSTRELHKQKKHLRHEIAETNSNIVTLTEAIAEMQQRLDQQHGTLAPQQLELAMLIGKLSAAGVSPQDQQAITTILRGLDDLTDRHDKTTALLDQGNMPPKLYSNGQIGFSAGPHRTEQLRDLLQQVREMLDKTVDTLKAAVAASVRSSSGSGETRRGRFTPLMLQYGEKALTSSYAGSEPFELPASGLYGGPAIPTVKRFSRDAAHQTPPADAAAALDRDDGKDAGPATAPASLQALVRVTQPRAAMSPEALAGVTVAEVATGAATTFGPPRPAFAISGTPAPKVGTVIDLPAVDAGLVAMAAPSRAAPSIMGTARLVLMAPPSPVEAAQTTPSPNGQALVGAKSSARASTSVHAMTTTSSLTQPSSGKSRTGADPQASPSRAEPAPSLPDVTATGAAGLLPKESKQSGAYHFGSDQLDWDWQALKVEYRVPAPLEQLPEGAVEVDSLRTESPVRLLSDTAYVEPTPKPAPAVSSSYTLGAQALRDKQTPIAQARTPATDPSDTTGPTLNDKGRSATMPEPARAASSMPPPRRATEPPRTSAPAGASQQPGPRPTAQPQPQPTAYRQHVNDPFPARPFMPAPTMPPDPRTPWTAFGPLHTVPPVMRDALINAAMRNQYWTTVWHSDVSGRYPGRFKLYYVVNANLPVNSVFPLSPPGTPNPLFQTIPAGNPYCHVLEILPPRAAEPMPSDFYPPMAPGPRNGASSFGTTDRASPRFVDPNFPNPFARKPEPEPVRRPGVRVPGETPQGHGEHARTRTRPSRSHRSEPKADSSRRYARETPREHQPGTSGRSRRDTRQEESFGREKEPRAAQSSREAEKISAGRPQEARQEDVSDDHPLVIEVPPIRLGKHASLPLLGTALPIEARRRVLNTILRGFKHAGEPIPRNPERLVTESDWHKEISAMLDEPEELRKDEYKEAKPTVARAKAVIDSLMAMGFDLGKVGDLFNELSYLWNNSNVNAENRPPQFAQAFHALVDEQVKRDDREHRAEYDKLDPPGREARQQEVRTSLLAEEMMVFKDYLRLKYQEVFSLPIDHPMLQNMLGRVRIKLNTYLSELAAKAVTDTDTFKAYGSGQRETLRNHLALQLKNGLDDAAINKVPGLRARFDRRLEEKLAELAHAAPDKVDTPEKRLAQRANLSTVLMGAEGKDLHAQFMLDSEFGAALRPVYAQLSVQNWAWTVEKLADQLKEQP
jgi:hypothetical protein